jgi:mannan polymerase II complex MNN10 subunit
MPSVWESARLKKVGAGGYPSFSTQNQGFFYRHMRRISSSLPRFTNNTHYMEKDKEIRASNWSARNVPLLGRIQGLVARMGRKWKIRSMLILLLLMSIIIFYNSRELNLGPTGVTL